MFLPMSFVALSALVAAYPSSQPYSDSPLTLSTTSGIVHGKIDPTTPRVRQFLGIPFAKPPLDDLRWAPPQSLHQPSASIDATAQAPSCMQYLTNQGDTLYVREVFEFNVQGLNHTGTISEDCLALSVWTPTTAPQPGNETSKGLPVFVFLPGGGFTTGGIDVAYQIPAQWVDRTQDHIVLSLNYRVNIFGFPNAPGLEDQNVGLLDQRLAVEWAKQNIAAFGGDPDRMVLWGQSAGAFSVDYYNYAYPEDPVVQGLIMDSGVALTDTTVDDPQHTNFTYVAENVGCAGLSNDTSAQLKCMRGVDAQRIEDFIALYSEQGNEPTLDFNPVPDEKVVFSNYTARALANHTAEIPAIIGTNTNDGIIFAPYSPNGPNETLVAQGLLSNFFCPATETISLRSQTGRDTYRYLYSGNFTNISPRPWLGAYHSSEQPLLFGTHPNYRAPSSRLEWETSEAMQDAWVAFAREGVSGLEGMGWSSYSVGGGNAREFGNMTAAQDVSLAAMESMCDGADRAT